MTYADGVRPHGTGLTVKTLSATWDQQLAPAVWPRPLMTRWGHWVTARGGSLQCDTLHWVTAVCRSAHWLTPTGGMITADDLGSLGAPPPKKNKWSSSSVWYRQGCRFRDVDGEKGSSCEFLSHDNCVAASPAPPCFLFLPLLYPCPCLWLCSAPEKAAKIGREELPHALQ